MSQISGSKNLFHTYEMNFRTDIANVEDEFGEVIKILLKNRIVDLSKVAEGFVPYQFESRLPIDVSKDIIDSKVQEKLVVKYYDRNIKKSKDFPEGLQQLFASSEVPEDTKKLIQKYLNKDVYNIFLQDFIFVPGESIKVIFPAEDKNNVLEYQLMRYFSDLFEFDIDIKVRKITQDVLKWLVWKIKKYNDGIVGDRLLIEEIKMYNSCAHLNEGEMKVSIEKTESNVFANLSMVLGQPCRGIELKLFYQEEEFCFTLFPDGIYSPVWSLTKFKGNENNRINRILILEKISLEIIPYIYDQYIIDKPNWDLLQDEIAEDAHNDLSKLFMIN